MFFGKESVVVKIRLNNVKQTLADLNTIPLEVYLSQPLMPLALEIAFQKDRAVYDCLYLALAITEQCQMVTADEKFYNALQTSNYTNNLLWVENI
ncbi:type II toxin-antitoxin system VapC family toxin [Anabaena azotica]|uniref:type II toxin-antitoxin system VapC family toxin n=1 Tax=Anabaena azotica TaxID=197653 RepID=UPI001F549085|nr:type II toxin-antitoxin system VapC family toxin [Anabaena azotica]